MGRDLRYILAYLYAADPDKTGALQVLEVAQLLRLVTLLTPAGAHAPGFEAPRPSNGSPRQAGWQALSRPASPPLSPPSKTWAERGGSAPFDPAAAAAALAADGGKAALAQQQQQQQLASVIVVPEHGSAEQQEQEAAAEQERTAAEAAAARAAAVSSSLRPSSGAGPLQVRAGASRPLLACTAVACVPASASSCR